MQSRAPLHITIGQGGISPTLSYHALLADEYSYYATSKNHKSKSTTNKKREKNPMLLMYDIRRTKTDANVNAAEGKMTKYCNWILVDTEPKVINRAISIMNGSILSSNCVIAQDQRGRGGCWGMGFNCDVVVKQTSSKSTRMSTHKQGIGISTKQIKSKPFREPLIPKILHAINAQSSKNASSSFVISHSLTGGTGSGVTSRLLCDLRDEYPKHTILSNVVFPFFNDTSSTSPLDTFRKSEERFIGTDSPLCAYNALLTLTYLCEYTDAVIWRSNSDIVRELSKRTSDRNEGEITIEDVNSKMALDLSGLLFPIKLPSCHGHGHGHGREENEGGGTVPMHVPHLPMQILDLPFSSLGKFLGLRSVLSSSSSESGTNDYERSDNAAFMALVKRLNGNVGVGVRGLGGYCVLRGVSDSDSGGNETLKGNVDKALRKGAYKHPNTVTAGEVKHNYVQSTLQPVHNNYNKTSSTISNSISCSVSNANVNAKSITMLSNHNTILPLLHSIHAKSRRMFKSKAYLHYYEREGVEGDDFEGAFEVLEAVLDEYRTVFSEVMRKG